MERRCPVCQHPLDEEAAWCPECDAFCPPEDILFDQLESPEGSSLPKTREPLAKDLQGVYWWVYEMNLLKNTAQLGMLLMVLAIAWLLMSLLLAVVAWMEGSLDGSIFVMIGIYGLAMLGLGLISWPVYILVHKKRYWAMFRMSETEIIHYQIRKDYDRKQVEALLAGIVNDTKKSSRQNRAFENSWTSEFAKVQKVKARPVHHLIELHQTMIHNQIFAAPQEYDFVLDYILAHVPKKTVRNFRDSQERSEKSLQQSDSNSR